MILRFREEQIQKPGDRRVPSVFKEVQTGTCEVEEIIEGRSYRSFGRGSKALEGFEQRSDGICL